ncbi:MAG: hypothetical protein ACYC1D_01635 [Acidimicrobiales bacterium]
MTARFRLLGAAAILTSVITGCSGPAHARIARRPPAPTTTVLQADHWNPPAVSGPPSTANFCTLLVADYRHLATNADATNPKVRAQILDDYAAFAPTVIAAAPPVIAPAATVYLGGIAKAVGAIAAAGLDPQKADKADVGGVIFDPAVQQAGNQVQAFSRQYCHYDIATGT